MVKEFREPLRSGKFKGDEYIGDIIWTGTIFIGTIMEVPPANSTQIFWEQITKTFDDYESAKSWVISEWAKKFG